MKTPMLNQNEFPMLITLDANIDTHLMNIIYIRKRKHIVSLIQLFFDNFPFIFLLELSQTFYVTVTQGPYNVLLLYTGGNPSLLLPFESLTTHSHSCVLWTVTNFSFFLFLNCFLFMLILLVGLPHYCASVTTFPCNFPTSFWSGLSTFSVSF